MTFHFQLFTFHFFYITESLTLKDKTVNIWFMSLIIIRLEMAGNIRSD